MKKTILILIVLAAVASSCEKYTLNKIYGTYTLNTYTVNGEDSLSLYNDSLGNNFEFYHDDVNNFNVCQIIGDRTDGRGAVMGWRWKLINDNKVIRILDVYGYLGTGPFGDNKKPDWEILHLTYKKIKMKTNYNGKEYLVELE